MSKNAPEGVSLYYAQKARIEINDEYLENICERDLQMMRKAFGYVVIAPFAGAIMTYGARLAAQDYSLTRNFA
eukprot:UN02105